MTVLTASGGIAQALAIAVLLVTQRVARNDAQTREVIPFFEGDNGLVRGRERLALVADTEGEARPRQRNLLVLHVEHFESDLTKLRGP